MLGHERDMQNKAQQKKKDKAILKEIKESNKERAEKGFDPKYLKKSKKNNYFMGLSRGVKGIKTQGLIRKARKIWQVGGLYQ